VTLNTVNTELGRPSGQIIAMNDAQLRNLAAAGGSGTITSMNQYRGKAYLGGICGGATPTGLFIGYGAAFTGGTIQRTTLGGWTVTQVTFNNAAQGPTSDQLAVYVSGLNRTIPYTQCLVVGTLGSRLYTLGPPSNSATDTFWQATDTGSRICTFGAAYQCYFR